MDSKKMKITLFFLMLSCAFMANSHVVYAAESVGQNGANWFLDQVFWVALAAIIAVIVMAAIKKNTILVITTFILGSIVTYLIKNPTKLETFGRSIASILGL